MTLSRTPQTNGLPFWAEGKVSLFAFEALKLCKGPYGYTGKPATMRKLAAKGLVRQLEGGAYVATEEGIDLIEGRCRCPPQYMRSNPLYDPADYGRLAFGGMARRAGGPRNPSQGAAGPASAAHTASNPYTVEPISGGCHVIRPQFGARIREREA